MKPRNAAIVGLLLLATCNEDFQAQDPNTNNVESSEKALGTVPASEVAVWQKVGDSSLPDGRYLQAAVFDSSRGVLVMFGGIAGSASYAPVKVQPNQETWEWNPKNGKWTNRTTTKGPEVRSGAAMVYDSDRKRVLLFGGRAGSGYDLEDTWEWEPVTGVWTNVSAAGSHPSARSQAGMVYEKGANKVLLFGGGRSSTNSYDGTGVSVSLGDTWELDTTTYKWTELKPTTAPTVRHDFGMVWDAANSRAVLFGGMQTDIADAPGIPKQDTWVWTAADGWSERTAAGAKPSQRYAHAMAFDAGRAKIMLFGGLDVSTGGSLHDLWEMDATSLAWTERLTGDETGLPSPRMYASLVYDDVSARLDLLAGSVSNNPYGMGGGPIMYGYPARGSRDIWEIEPVQLTLTDRSSPLDVPGPRTGQSMAYDPSTQKTYLFGGYDQWTGKTFNDLWAWNGKTWAQVTADSGPDGRSDGALAYDPARKSLILFGGINNFNGTAYSDTWEFANGKWTLLNTKSNPPGLYGHRMVTDMARKKILLFGGVNMNMTTPVAGYMSPLRNDVWEWDGVAMTWTNRTPTAATTMPSPRYNALVSFDDGRQKLFLFESNYYGSTGSTFWEWDPVTAGWEGRDTGDGTMGYGSYMFLAYDSIRRRHVILSGSNRGMSGTTQDTWEIDTKGPTLYIRTTTTSPTAAYGATMVFDSARGVAVFYGGQNPNTGMPLSDTWEYKVSNLGNGEGCTADFATTCASGFCVDGVCCEAAACTGACKSCNVAGSEGTCVMAKAGTEVPGSCEAGLACDGTGSCKAKNGQACTAASACASGFCVDGVCCDGACSGACASCNQAGREGKCTPYAAGSDPQNECGKGSGICKSTCDGVTGCAFPQTNVTCGTCMLCNGIGDCSVYDYSYMCMYTGGNFGGTGGYYPRGGSGGYIPMGGSAGSGGVYPRGGSGGSGGSVPRSGGAGGGIPLSGGVGGGIVPSGGTTVPKGGAGGAFPQVGGTTGTLPVAGAAGTLPKPDGSAGSTSVIPGAGGSTVLRDGGGDGSTSTLSSKTGCSCELGSGLGRSGLSASFLLAAAAVVLRRRRRR